MSLERNFKGFGDALVNFLYSLAKSRATGEWTGEKVSNYVLSQALILSEVESPGGLDKHEKGDYVEGYIGKAWIDKIVTTEEAASILHAFRDLLNYIQQKWFSNQPHVQSKNEKKHEDTI
jgi:hypothetical protein